MSEDSISRSENSSSLTDAQILLGAIADYAIYKLDPAGLVCSWNDPAQRFKGYAAKDIIGRHFSQFYTQEDVAAGVPARALWTAISEGKFEDEGWRVRADGSRMWASVVINPIFDAHGSHKGFVKITRDISAKREADEKLREAHASIAQMQKMESIGRVAGGIAHDFNNLLTAIFTSVDTIKLNNNNTDISLSISTIESAAQHGAQLTSQLLSFARNQPLVPVRFSVRKCLHDMLPILQSIVGDHISLHARLSRDDAVVEIDIAQFRAAIINLVTNAKDAVQDGGMIEINSKIKTTIPVIRNHHPVAGRYVAISVIDNGSGISSNIVDKLFEPFFTTKPLYHGTGLGLSQVYGFSRQSGGNVAVIDGTQHNTEIRIYLPLAASIGTIEDVALAHARSAAPPNARILFVEDNKMIGAAAARALIALGYSVVWLENAEIALDILASRPEEFDIIVSDIVMPGISGISFAKKVKDKYPLIPVILTSGYTDELAHLSSIDCEFIKKPYRIVDLAECVSTALSN